MRFSGPEIFAGELCAPLASSELKMRECRDGHSLIATPGQRRNPCKLRCGYLRRTRGVLEASTVRARNRDEARGCTRKA